jgi:hypothetical protein
VIQGSPEPEFAAKPARHFVNLFEPPFPFIFVGCLTAMITDVSGVVVDPRLGLCRNAACPRIHPLGPNRVRHRRLHDPVNPGRIEWLTSRCSRVDE